MSPSKHNFDAPMHQDDKELTDLSQFPNRIGATLDNKTIFLTGATGYVGKALVEKMLHYSNVKKIYMLIKPKRGKNASERMETYFDSPLFDSLKNDCGKEIFKKVEVVSGDIGEIDLGISREDRLKLIKEVNVIFHSAASVRFDEMLKKIVLLNVRGTRFMLALAKEVKNLQLFCYISTTFCVPANHELPEGPVTVPHNPHEIIKMAEHFDNNILNTFCAKIIGEHGNTYGFSKALAEGLIYEQQTNLPVMIVRPSIVLPIWRHPYRGFFDSLNGPLGLWLLYGKAILRIIPIKMRNKLNYVPLDSVTNATMISVYNYLNDTEMKTMVCNTTNLDISMFAWIEHIMPMFHESPFEPGLGYPGASFTECEFLRYIILMCFQLFPSIIIDAFTKLRGSKPKMIMLQKTVYRTFKTLQYYTEHSWPVKTDHFRQLRMNINDREDAIYPLAIEEIDLRQYSHNFLEFAKKFTFHEKPDQGKQNAKTLMRYYIIYIILKYGFYLLIAYFGYCKLLPLIN